jgi:hypothetical protein
MSTSPSVDEEANGHFHMPLPLQLIVSNRDHMLERLLLSCRFECPKVMIVDHNYDAVTQLLRVRLCAACIKTLEKIVFCLVIAWTLQDLNTEAASPDRKLLALIYRLLFIDIYINYEIR